MRIIKKILCAVVILGLLFIGLIMFVDDDGTYVAVTSESGTETSPEVKSGTSVENEGYYTLVLEDGGKVDILIPQSIFEGQYKNLNDRREESVFNSIYNYDHDAEIYITYIPDVEQTLKGILKGTYAVGSIFNFVVRVTGGPVDNIVSGDVEGDDSVSGLLHIDTSYIGDEKNELMFDDMVSFDAVYSGLDLYSTPTFIALNMEVQ